MAQHDRSAHRLLVCVLLGGLSACGGGDEPAVAATAAQPPSLLPAASVSAAAETAVRPAGVPVDNPSPAQPDPFPSEGSGS